MNNFLSKLKTEVGLTAIPNTIKQELKRGFSNGINQWTISVTVSLHFASHLQTNTERHRALLPSDYWQVTRTCCFISSILTLRGTVTASAMWKSHQRLVSLLWKLPCCTAGIAAETTNSVQSVSLDPHLFFCHLFMTSVSIVRWGQSSFKWQLGGTFEHVMWSSRTPYTTTRSCVSTEPVANALLSLSSLWDRSQKTKSAWLFCFELRV